MIRVALTLRTAPDLAAGRRLLGLSGLDDADTLKAMEHVQRQRRGDASFSFALRRVIALSLVVDDGRDLRCVSAHAGDHDEAAMLRLFFKFGGVDETLLITWNGAIDALPVLQTRALIHDVSSTNYWHDGRDPSRHLEIAPLITGGMDAALDLGEVAVLSGLPAIRPFSEEATRDAAVAGDYAALSGECDQFAMHTYLLFLRLLRIRGEITAANYAQRLALAHACFARSEVPAQSAYAAAWEVAAWGATDEASARAVRHGA